MTKKKKSKKKDANKQTLGWFLGISIGIIVLVISFFLFTRAQMHFNYKGIEFEAVNEGTGQNPLIFYQTNTLLVSNDGLDQPFGFRLRTKPSKLKRVAFDELENFNLMSLNAYSYGENTFNCGGDGVIAMPNFQRVFQKMGMQIIHDENASCDEQERYNYFMFKYGDKTEIKEIAPKCYEVIIKGNDEKCEILPATEKLMVEIFVKYRDLTGQ